MTRLLLTTCFVTTWLVSTGCATTPKAADRPQAQITGLPGLAAYYEQATADHHRAVRKPTRDRRARALHALAEKTQALLAETASWDSDVRLVAVAEPERPAARAAVSDFRTALAALRDAAATGNVGTVRTTYARALGSYRHLSEKVGNLE